MSNLQSSSSTDSFTQTLPHFWLRHEVKPLEKRTALLPEHARQLIDAGCTVTVERSTVRCVADSEYEKVGCELVDTGSWKKAPEDAVILGLKELPEETDPLTHNHIYFAHCYKQQTGWKGILRRFEEGRGRLWDLEFLTDQQGRRVAAFGRSAGFIGMAVGLLSLCQQRRNAKKELENLPYFSSFESLVETVKMEMNEVGLNNEETKVCVLGALGRCGGGALECARRIGLKEENIGKWDIEQTKKGGPFPELLDFDVLVNCIYLSGKVPAFITSEMLLDNCRRLSVLADVSCDYTSPNHPFPFYWGSTSFQHPTLRVLEGNGERAAHPVDVISIDHLPSLVPYESSRDFGRDLLSHLLQFRETGVWERAETLFKNKLKEAHMNTEE